MWGREDNQVQGNYHEITWTECSLNTEILKGKSSPQLGIVAFAHQLSTHETDLCTGVSQYRQATLRKQMCHENRQCGCGGEWWQMTVLRLSLHSKALGTHPPLIRKPHPWAYNQWDTLLPFGAARNILNKYMPVLTCHPNVVKQRRLLFLLGVDSFHC